MRTVTIFLFLATLVAGTSALAGVSVLYDREVPFTSYRTYAWLPGTPANPLAQRRIEDAVNRQLAEMGYERVEESPDFFVVTHAARSTRTEVDINTFGYHDRYPFRGWRGRVNTETATIREIPMGTLLVDILDAGSRELVWRGTATAAIGNKPEKNQKKLNKLLGKMFHRFPPGP